MLEDPYGLALTTDSAAARDAYAAASERALTFYPGALAAYQAALDADPEFALAHAGKAQVLMRQGDVVAARAALAAARERRAGLSEREAGHIGFFELVFAGRTEAAIAALEDHLARWPRDAPVVAAAANPNGLIGGSGRIGQKHRIAMLMDGLASHYGDDPWFMSYHALALCEDGRLTEARAKIERSLAGNPNNAHGAHGLAHVCYETGDLATARGFLSAWLTGYPRDGFFHGHLSWHLALCEIAAGDWAAAQRLYRDAIALERHSGGPQQKVSDGAALLWRAELAGHRRDVAAWQALHAHAERTLPRPGSGLADLHVLLAQAVVGDAAGLDARTAAMAVLAQEGRYPSGDYLPSLARGFQAYERGALAPAIEAFGALSGQNERIGGSRAQHDLIEFTLLRAYLDSDRPDEARALLGARRAGATGVPVRGVAAVR